jgi:hypothetical protein
MPPGLAWWPATGLEFAGLLIPLWRSLQAPTSALCCVHDGFHVAAKGKSK